MLRQRDRERLRELGVLALGVEAEREQARGARADPSVLGRRRLREQREQPLDEGVGPEGESAAAAVFAAVAAAGDARAGSGKGGDEAEALFGVRVGALL